MKDVITKFSKKMKMSELIDAEYTLLLLLHRLNISLGFGEKTVESVCEENGFDSDCFIFLANIQSNSFMENRDEVFDKLPLEPFLYYLKSSHLYFLEERLPNIRRKLVLVLEPEEAKLKEMILVFFDNYMEEVREHMLYEDVVVFPYIQALNGRNKHNSSYSIETFEERHSDIEDKMNDLKQLLMKYIPANPDNQLLMINILMELYMSEEELATHTYIENGLVIPRVKRMEKG